MFLSFLVDSNGLQIKALLNSFLFSSGGIFQSPVSMIGCFSLSILYNKKRCFKMIARRRECKKIVSSRTSNLILRVPQLAFSEKV